MSNTPHDRPSASFDPPVRGTGPDAAAARPGEAPVPAEHPGGHPGDARATPARASSPRPATPDAPATRGVSGTVWAALVLGVVVLILLLVFILQNNVGTHFEYMAWSFSLPLGVAMLLSAIAGALIMALVGSVRIFTLGHRLRKLERERIRHTGTD